MTINVIREKDVHQVGDMKGKVKDKLHKIRPLIDILSRTFVALVRAGAMWSIDESICPYRGKYCPCKVYMKDKPHKFGVKIWMNNCAETGYCYNFKVYEGKGDVFPDEPVEWAKNFLQGERVVLNLCTNIPTGSYVFADRFFNTPGLCAEMLRQGNFCTGTVMKNKAGLDHRIFFTKNKKHKRGFYQYSLDTLNKVAQICWLDRQPVLLCTNCYGAERSLEGIPRLTTHTGKYQRLNMRAPVAAVEYNKYMGGTDRFDRLKLNR
jgi:Transposase IS4